MFYKLIHNLKYKVQRLYGIIHTKCRLIANDVKHKKYSIAGVPFLNVNGGGGIFFGNNLQMNNGLMSNRIGYNTPCILRAEGGSITIGDNVGMSQTTLIAKGADISIGNNVKLGGGVKVYTTDFHCLEYEKRRDPKIDMLERKCSSVLIEDDCFIGAGVIVLKGVTIGARSVIGAGSVVTKDIPSDCIAAGNPCKIIRRINN